MASFIQVAKPYVFEQNIQQGLRDTDVSQTREDNIRLAGVQWIDNVRRAPKLPVRTFDTAVVCYHKFRLVHSDGEYSFSDAAAAALFTACKIEDTLKKSRDILCAAYNLKLSPSEHLSADDALFEQHSRTIIGLERLMLEASGFDFRGRHPQQLMIKLARYYNFSRDSPLIKTAYGISLDLYRTFAPLKQTTAVMAFACLELAGRLLNEHNEEIESGQDYDRWSITRGMVMETLLDLLELYTHYRTSTCIGPDFPVDTFLQVRIPLNEELEAKRLPRFSEYFESRNLNFNSNKPVTNGKMTNGTGAKASPKNVSPRDVVSPASHASGSASGSRPTSAPQTNGTRTKIGERGKDGTVRFMLNPDREREERAVVAEYSKPEDNKVQEDRQDEILTDERVHPSRRR